MNWWWKGQSGVCARVSKVIKRKGNLRNLEWPLALESPTSHLAEWLQNKCFKQNRVGCSAVAAVSRPHSHRVWHSGAAHQAKLICRNSQVGLPCKALSQRKKKLTDETRAQRLCQDHSEHFMSHSSLTRSRREGVHCCPHSIHLTSAEPSQNRGMCSLRRE